MEERENKRVEFESGCRTPRQGGIPANLVCPPAPRKKRVYGYPPVCPPEDGFFQPPDLELVFAPLPLNKQGKFDCRN